MRLSGITPESIVDGPGLRYVIFTQGCLHECPKCHNPESWDINAGREFSVKQIIRMIKKQNKTPAGSNTPAADASRHTVIQGVTFSGGEPFLQAGELAEVALAAHQIGWDVVTYTGYTYEELVSLSGENSGISALVNESDILIDGKYIHKKRNVGLQFRGSSNQRVINMAETRKSGNILLWKDT